MACTLLRISTLMTDGFFFSQNQGGLDSMDFSVNFDALIYIFLITVKTELLRDRQTFP